jgi:hypothetical protein
MADSGYLFEELEPLAAAADEDEDGDLGDVDSTGGFSLSRALLGNSCSAKNLICSSLIMRQSLAKSMHACKLIGDK